MVYHDYFCHDIFKILCLLDKNISIPIKVSTEYCTIQSYVWSSLVWIVHTSFKVKNPWYELMKCSWNMLYNILYNTETHIYMYIYMYIYIYIYIIWFLSSNFNKFYSRTKVAMCGISVDHWETFSTIKLTITSCHFLLSLPDSLYIQHCL